MMMTTIMTMIPPWRDVSVHKYLHPLRHSVVFQDRPDVNRMTTLRSICFTVDKQDLTSFRK